MAGTDTLEEWEASCMHWRGRVLDGKWAHECQDWDFLPVDETTDEWSCCNCEWDGEQPPAKSERSA
jgi:hypothetical protein